MIDLIFYIVELLNLSDEKVTESGGDLGVSNVNHLIVDIKVNLGRRAKVLVGLIWLDVAHFVFEAQQDGLQIFWTLYKITKQLNQEDMD